MRCPCARHQAGTRPLVGAYLRRCDVYGARTIYLAHQTFQCAAPDEAPEQLVSIQTMNRRARAQRDLLRWGRIAVTAVALLLMAATAFAQTYTQATAHITSQTTTTIATANAGFPISIMAGSICVDTAGATTSIAIQDGNGLNLFGSGVVWVLGAGSCLNFPLRGLGGSPVPYGLPTALGKSLQIVTGVGNGPVEVYLEVTLR